MPPFTDNAAPLGGDVDDHARFLLALRIAQKFVLLMNCNVAVRLVIPSYQVSKAKRNIRLSKNGIIYRRDAEGVENIKQTMG